MKPVKQPEEHVRCPRCKEPYRFTKCRVSQYDKDGKRYELCLTCAVLEEKEKRLSTSTVKS